MTEFSQIKQRNTSIELLRLISMLMIVFSHCILLESIRKILIERCILERITFWNTFFERFDRFYRFDFKKEQGDTL